MSNKRRKMKKDARRRGWILARNLYPLAMVALILISLSIPCLRYTTADTGTNETISQWELMGNAWEQSRQYLFGTEEQTSGNTLFCQTVLGTLIGFYLLFFVGAIGTVAWSLGAIWWMREPKGKGSVRALYLTLFPNRPVSVLWSLMMLPLLTFPRLLVFFYRRYFYYSVLLNVTFPEPLVLGVVLLLILVGITIGFRSVENKMGVSPYPTKAPKGVPIAEESYESQFSAKEEPYDELSRRTKEEQAERIRRLLEGQEPSSTKENERNDT